MADDGARLIATIEANTKQFENALKRLEGVTKGSTDRMTASVKKLDSSFTGLGNKVNSIGKSFVAGLAGSVSIGAIQQLIKATVAWGDALGDLADQTGISAKQIQILRYAAKQTGSSAEQMDASLKKFGVTLAQARTKGNDLKKILDANGISLTDMAGKARPAGDVLNDVIDLIGRLGDEQQKGAVIAAAFGKGNDELITTFRNGLGPIQKWGTELAKSGLVSDDTVKKLGELDAKFNEVMTNISAIAANVVANMELDKMLDYISRSVEELADLVNIANLIQKGDVAGAVEAATTRGVRRMTPQQKVEYEITNVKEDLNKLFARLEQLQGLGKTGAGGMATVAGPIAEVSAAIEADSKKLKELLTQRERLRKEATEPVVAPTTNKPGVIPEKEEADKDAAKAAKEAASELDRFTEALRNAGDFAFSLKQAPEQFQRAIFAAAEKQGIPPNLLASILHAESGFAPDVISGKRRSSAGAIGIAQFMPGTARELGVDPTDPFSSITGAAKYLRQLIDMFNGDVASAIAAYNAGPGRVKAFLAGTGTLPAETRAYVPKVMTATTLETRAGEEEKNFEAVTKANEGFVDKQIAALDELRDVSKNVLGGLISDLEHGATAGEAMANALGKIADKLLDMALDQIISSLFGPVGTALPGAIGGAFVHAGGGVMTSRGPMPLRRYQGGGVAHSPQVAVFGEGGRPEAYVPLPDGRRIPVNIRVPGMGGLGGGRGGQGVSVHNRVTVDASPLFVVTTREVARQAGHAAVAEAGDASRRRPGGR